MKWMLMLSLSISLNVFAQKKPMKQEKSFEEKKAQMLEHLESRINSLNESKVCVQNAKDKQALKDCRKARKDSRKFNKVIRREKRS